MKVAYEIDQLHYVMGLLCTFVQCQLLVLCGDQVRWEDLTVKDRQPNSDFLPVLEDATVKLFASGRDKVTIDPVIYNSGDVTPSLVLTDESMSINPVTGVVEDDLQEVTKSIVHAFQLCNYHRRALFYQAQLACLYKRNGWFEEAVFHLRQIVPKVDNWKEMQVALELQLLDCLLKLRKLRDAFEVAVDICSKGPGVVRPAVAEHLCAWILNCIHSPSLREELVLPGSKILDAEVSFSQARYMVDEKAVVLIRASCKLPVAQFHVDRLQVSLLGNDPHGLISDKVMLFTANDIDLGPISRLITIESKAEAAGVYKLRRLLFHIGRLKLVSELEEKGKVVFESDRMDVVMQARIPSLLAYGHLQAFAVEVQNRRGTIKDAKLSWLPMKVRSRQALQLDSTVQCFIRKSDQFTSCLLPTDRNSVSLPVLDQGISSTLLFNIRLDEEEPGDPEDFDLTVHSPDPPSLTDQPMDMFSTTSKNERVSVTALTSRYSEDTFKVALNYTDAQNAQVVISETIDLIFVDPLAVLCRLVRSGATHILSVHVESHCQVCIQIISWSLFGCRIVQDCNEEPVTLRVGQESHFAFKITDLEPGWVTVECRYRPLYRAVSSSKSEFVDRVKQQQYIKRGKVMVPLSSANSLKVMQISPRRLSLFSDEEVNLGEDEQVDLKPIN